MISLKGPKGLGDAIYLRVIARHYIAQGETVEVFTQWPDVFLGLDVRVRGLGEIDEGSEDLRSGFYCLFCRIAQPKSMDQYSMMCVQAGLSEPPPLRMDWLVRNPDLIDKIRRKAGGRKILVYQPPKKANNEEQAMLRPLPEAFNRELAKYAEHFRVRIGHPKYLQSFESPCDMDLFGKTSVCDAFDIGSIGDMFFGDSCFVLVMADAMEKPSVCLLTRRGLNSNRQRLCNVTTQRIFYRPHLVTTVFDESA